MTRFVLGFAALTVVFSVNTNAWAGRCLDIAETRIVWCDDFDNYCVGGATWTGYPPFPTICATDATADNSAFMANWLLPVGWLGTGFLENQSVTSETGPNTARQLSHNEPFTLKFAGAGYDGGPSINWLVPTRHVFSLAPAIQAKDNTKNAVNGTNDNSLKLKFYLNHYTGGSGAPGDGSGECRFCNADAGNAIWYVDLTMDDDHAPTDYIQANCLTNYTEYGGDGAFKGVFPIICQQTQAVFGCPPLSTTIRASIAVGLLALLDPQPCNVENGRRPTNYHLSYFDGLKWRDLRSNVFPGNGGDFGVGSGGVSWLNMEVKADEVFLEWDSWVIPAGSTERVEEYSTATIPRLYTGGFNKISSGPAPGCELNSGSHTCKAPPTYDAFKYCSGTDLTANGDVRGSKPNWCWRNTFADTPVLFDGVLVVSDGACCASDGTCSETTPEACAAANGRFQGSNTSCESVTCCPLPFADADHDGDVDQDDFGAFQICYNGEEAVPIGCACFDRNQDNHVDSDDFIAFSFCWTGANVPWSQAVTPSCNP